MSMEHNPNNLKCDKNKCGSYVNCNNYECNGEHGQVSCTCQPQKYNKTQLKSGWEEEFDMFYALPENMKAGPQRENAIKDFIRQLITQAKEEGRREAVCTEWHVTTANGMIDPATEARLATITLFEEYVKRYYVLDEREGKPLMEKADLLAFAESLKKKV